ncbi:MAG: type III pantothenate kinase [Bacteroidetes bacterium]|nr:type III pantothenate kinase [Bacteroidota bacterium]
MKLVIDIGNTFTKLAIFEQTEIIKLYHFKQFGIEELYQVEADYSNINSAIVSTVNKLPQALKDYLYKSYHFIELNSNTPIPIVNKYKTPETLGNDRLAAVVAGASLYPNQNVLVIDAGSCITFDFVNRKNEYIGGSISPGIQIRFKAMNSFTQNLPLIEYKKVDYLIGSTTEESILSGVLNGVLNEIDGIITSYKGNYENLTIILGGGDYIYFDKRLKNNIFAIPNIVLLGLNVILDFNDN